MKITLLSLAFATALTSTVSAVNLSFTNVGGGVVSGLTYTQGAIGTTANTNNWPSAESPASATDNISTGGNKYLNFAKTNTAVAVNANVGSASLVVNGLTFFTGNDAPERDPSTFTLYGSATPIVSGNLNLSLMTLIASNISTGLTTDPGRNALGTFQSFPNSTAYAGYVLVFPDVRTNGSANSMQVGEVFFANIPEPGTFALSGLAFLGFLRRRR